mmetsp:Transcript_20712/g.52443  ORF Transcript_20712/g.52443 Transcript_20712/m.52443 type:complete len:297 (+) Transcript_20712:185-1075(+)|eukprot:CAMPEP_0177628310 /NCGR_PEP_ID=MMETSP0447-20121125/63_1 /TAXON_ID=0 /ORGANISM="Stygamoeba regulata, Strain BSH-02190019" /LENGTH=296 /DNA_ID=CAMNT_0019129549 /DNA_START=176 /DNA_END=1066 /DNA_ORIENTATION=+
MAFIHLRQDAFEPRLAAYCLLSVLLWSSFCFLGVRLWLAFSLSFAIIFLLPSVLRQSGTKSLSDVSESARHVLHGNFKFFACSVVAGVFSILGDFVLIPKLRNSIIRALSESESILLVLHLCKKYGMMDALVPIFLALIFVFSFLDFRNARIREKLVLCLKACVVTAGVTGFLKFLCRRKRPMAMEGPLSWRGPGLSYDGNGIHDLSFPSGHTAVAFTLTVVSTHLFRNIHPWVTPALYTLAFANALARFLDKNHWLSDVVFGCSIGFFVGCVFVRILCKAGLKDTACNPTALKNV